MRSPTSLTRRVTRLAVGTLVGTLVLTGLGTAALLYARVHDDLDQALLAGAVGEAHPWSTERWRTEGVELPVTVHPWRPGDPAVPAEVAAEVQREERPHYLDVGDRRVLVIAFEPAAVDHGDEGSHPHEVLVAEAPAVRPADVVGPFLVAWSVLTAAVGLVAATGLGSAIRAAMRPLERAAADLAALPGLPQGARLSGGGHDEVDTVIRSVNDLLGRLEVAFAAQQRFTMDAAHELRTPVTVLLGELDLALRRERDRTGYREAIGRAREEAQRLRERVEALMALARVEAGQAGTGRAPEHLSSLVLAALAAEREALVSTGTEVQVVEGPDPELDVHGPLVTLAIANLVRNAAHHAPGSAVTVRTEVADGRVSVLVDDRGVGVRPEDREVVFERFHRGTTVRRGDGLGLGLPLAREIARRHGGDVRLEEGRGGGCRARLELPLPAAHGIPIQA